MRKADRLSLVDARKREPRRFGHYVCLQCAARDCEHITHPPVFLTRQETHLLRVLTKGSSNKEIAHAIQLGEGTVKIYMMHIFRKLNLNNRLEAALWAIAHLDLVTEEAAVPQSRQRDLRVG